MHYSDMLYFSAKTLMLMNGNSSSVFCLQLTNDGDDVSTCVRIIRLK